MELTDKERDTIIARSIQAGADRERAMPGVDQPTDLLLAIVAKELVRTNEILERFYEKGYGS